ncbi:MAG: hypothetical protein KBF65_10260 [Rubrivivax sp.]|jgi:hypothetical protein|nr:hypothetical protein [Betaproteobacteria bacterium]MBP6318274.1 hypothetical protein [Rubrivivax sp.]MBK7517056.1 hypothetical protein [Betaproteobacteria bacterium]MBK8866090.1 hypothetical protein [Betaproteobacteria bacterium]MBK9683369.1 hypothetical protein [Betaproteobacteria bacterium]
MRKPLLALVLTSFCVVAWKVRWAVLVTIDWADPTNTVPPVQFDAQRRRWQANHLPEPPARAEGLSLPLSSMTVPDNVTPVIVAAAWTDAAGQRRTLARPLYRNSKARAWRRLNCGIALREVTCEPERRPGA